MKFIYLLFLVVLCSCTAGPYTIKYEATGSSGTLNVAYIDENGNNQSYTGTSPWNYSFSAKKGASLKVSASCDVTGTSSVHIFINAVDKKDDTETGINATASTTAQ